MNEPQCGNCDCFVRDLGVCANLQIQTEATAVCAAWRERHACRVCGCSHWDPCPEGCWWVEPDLCSSCARRPLATSKAYRLTADAPEGWK
jgi:hypothetical protein